MANWYVSSPGWAAVTPWAASTAVTVGTLRRQLATPAALAERVFRVTTAGTTGTAEPTWNLNKNATTTDNGVVWQEVTGQEAYQAPGAWAAPLATIVQGTVWAGSGDVILVDANHNKTIASAPTLSGTFGTTPKSIICVDASASSHVPPLASDVRTGATEGTSGTNDFYARDSFAEINGIKFFAGGNLNFASGGASIMPLKNCTLALTGTAGSIILGYSNGTKMQLDNVSLQFNATNQTCFIPTELLWRDTSTLLLGTVKPTLMFSYYNGQTAGATFENVDFTTYTSGTMFGNVNGGAYIRCIDCKIPTGVTISAPPIQGNSAIVELVNCDTGTALGRHERYLLGGSQFFETAVVRTGGAATGAGVPHSWRMLTNAYSLNDPPASMPSLAWNTSVGSSLTATIEGVWNAAILPTQAEIWLDVRFPGTAGSTLGSRSTGARSSGLATASSLPASTAAWDSLVAARTNSQAYTVGQIVKVASNPGRIFFCTAAGTSAASEPAGYASAVDGGTITDGSATFRAGVRFKLQASLTPAVAGLISATIRAARASSTFYVDPLLTVG